MSCLHDLHSIIFFFSFCYVPLYSYTLVLVIHIGQIFFTSCSAGSAYSPLPLRTHAQDSRARDLEDSDHNPTSFNSHHIQNTHLDALQNNHGPSTLHVAAVASTAPNLNSHGGQMVSSHSNSQGGPSHQNSNSHGGPTGSSHPIPSTKKKPAPLPPVRTPPTPPKKAPLRLPAENT